ncbi:hypothetical protein Syun_021148 [Stephania yunnanensis]|uniref:Uncharacterized protein n=1 Tax=Stephania yunnanensis TaxID=152371 RepID=A0AAP0IF70_9MAGN
MHLEIKKKQKEDTNSSMYIWSQKTPFDVNQEETLVSLFTSFCLHFSLDQGLIFF